MKRREFVVSVLAGSVALTGASCRRREKIPGLRLTPVETFGGIQTKTGETPLDDATWYVADVVDDGLLYHFAPGALAAARYLTADFLQDGKHRVVFRLTLREGGEGRAFHFQFAGLSQCSYRVRMPLDLIDQNRWGIDREGAFLKPRVSGDRVDLAKVDRMELRIARKSPEPVRWCMTDFIAAEAEPPYITEPVLPKGPLLDELGQSTLHQWPAKSKSADEVTSLIRRQLDEAPRQKWPDGFSPWGGWRARRLAQGSGFFRTHHDGRRWWLVDPDGCAFWSIGLDCIRVDTTAHYDLLESALTWLPEGEAQYAEVFDQRTAANGREMKSISYLAANLIRALGPAGWRPKWAEIVLSVMRGLRFNTVGNWSEWEWAKQARFPYVRPMSFSGKRVRKVYRDFPDVFDPNFEQDAADYASQLADTRDDPAFLGYFLMNEPQWGFSKRVCWSTRPPVLPAGNSASSCAGSTPMTRRCRRPGGSRRRSNRSPAGSGRPSSPTRRMPICGSSARSWRNGTSGPFPKPARRWIRTT